MKSVKRRGVAFSIALIMAFAMIAGIIPASAEENLPERFDQRDLGIVTPVKKQSPFQTCWAFAATSAIETSVLSWLGMTYEDTVLPGTEGQEYSGLDFSEKHLAWYSLNLLTPEDDPKQAGEGLTAFGQDTNPLTVYNTGGDFKFFTTLIASGVGPVFEDLFPYKGKEGFTEYEFYLANRDTLVAQTRAQMESSWGKTIEEGIEEDRTAGLLEEEIVAWREMGWIDDSITADNITGQILVEGRTDATYRVYETNDEYSNKDDWTIDNLGLDGQSNRFRTSGFTMTDGNFLPDYSFKNAAGQWTGINSDGINATKKELMKGHGVIANFKADEAVPGQQITTHYMNYDTYAHYTYDDVGANHAIAIVGWDDNYSVDNFNEGYRPPGNGAWIVKNSWGSETDYVVNENSRDINRRDWGVKDENGNSTGYFYISYYDKTLGGAESLVFSGNMYNSLGFYAMQYDYMTSLLEYDFEDDNEMKTSNIFTYDAGFDGNLQSVSTKTAGPNSTVKFEIYALGDNASSPTDGILMQEFTRDFEYAGYHRTDVDTPIHLKNGDRISIVATEMGHSNSGGQVYKMCANASISQEAARAHNIAFYSNAVVNDGESFVYSDGKWQDWKYAKDAFTESKYGTGKDADAYVDAQIDNFSVKAFVVPADGENNDTPSTDKKVTPPKTSIR